MDMAFNGGLILVLLVLIVAVCALFTNGIEWAGHRFNLSEGAVGSVLAAVGTALPETLVPLIAILSGLMAGSGVSTEASHEIGIGAILGAPFLLSTLAMFVTGVAVYVFSARKKRDLRLKFHSQLFRRDFHYFFPAYIMVFLAAFIENATVKTGLGIGLLAFYGMYVYRTLKKEHMPDAEFDLPALYFAPRSKEPATWLILAEVAFALLALLTLVHFFVGAINKVSLGLGINAMVLSLIITPIATELPEKFNSVVWIGHKKDGLALGNITGAMVFQSCIPTAIGLIFTPWVLSQQGMLSVGLCLVSSLIIYMTAWHRHSRLLDALMLGGVFYLIFIGYSVSLI